jgi:hypothetical protein
VRFEVLTALTESEDSFLLSFQRLYRDTALQKLEHIYYIHLNYNILIFLGGGGEGGGLLFHISHKQLSLVAILNRYSTCVLCFFYFPVMYIQVDRKVS